MSTSSFITEQSHDCFPKIHTFVAPLDQMGNATHVIEGVNSLIVIDTQYTLPMAKSFKNFVDSLNKPIEYIFITHSHPDHYLGLEAFINCNNPINVGALIKTIEEIEQSGQQMLNQSIKTMGSSMMASNIIIPNIIVEPGLYDWEGIQLDIRSVVMTESSDNMVIFIPALNAIIVQDLVYNHMHLWVAERNFNNWINWLKQLKQTEFDTLLVGHGYPTCDRNIIDDNIYYLQMAKNLLNNKVTVQKFDQQMIEAFPDFRGRELFAIQDKILNL